MKVPQIISDSRKMGAMTNYFSQFFAPNRMTVTRLGPCNRQSIWWAMNVSAYDSARSCSDKGQSPKYPLVSADRGSSFKSPPGTERNLLGDVPGVYIIVQAMWASMTMFHLTRAIAYIRPSKTLHTYHSLLFRVFFFYSPV